MPIFFGLYLVVPGRKAKNIWLLPASLVFYAWGEPVYIFLMLASIVANWAFGIALGKAADRRPEGSVAGTPPRSRKERLLLLAAVGFNVAVIGSLKYAGFLADNINALVGADVVSRLNLPLPIGISFYTLQALSYVIDRSRLHDI